MQDEKNPEKYSFEEFKLYFDTTEKVVDRKLKNNEWNYSICIGIVLALALALNWSLANPNFGQVIYAVGAIVSPMGALFCKLWIAQLGNYKVLNKVKFEILNEMAPRVVFDTQQPDLTLISYEPFKQEWERLQKEGALQKRPRYGVQGLSASRLEFYIPETFRIVFILATIVSAGAWVFPYVKPFISVWYSR